MNGTVCSPLETSLNGLLRGRKSSLIPDEWMFILFKYLNIPSSQVELMVESPTDDWFYGYIKFEKPKVWKKCFEILDKYLAEIRKHDELRSKTADARMTIHELNKEMSISEKIQINAQTVHPTKFIPLQEFTSLQFISIDEEGDGILLEEMLILLEMLNDLGVEFEPPKKATVGLSRFLPEKGLCLIFEPISL